MTKGLKMILFILVLLILVSGLAYYYHQQTQRRAWEKQLEQVEYYIPSLFISDYAFVNKGEAVAIAWEDVDPDEFDYLVKELSLRPDGGYPFVSGQGYILSMEVKLYDDPNLPKDTGPVAFQRNIPQKGEYWRWRVYQVKGDTLEERVIDIFEAIRRYDSDYVPSPQTMTLYSKGNQVVAPISIRLKDGGEETIVEKVLDLSTGKIIDTPLSQYQKLSLMNFVVDTTLYDKLTSRNIFMEFSNNAFVPSWASKSDGDHSVLAKENIQAFKLLKKKESLHVLSTHSDIQSAGESISLLLPEGTNLYENVTIPADVSVDGQSHVVNSYEEFVQYYKAPESTP